MNWLEKNLKLSSLKKNLINKPISKFTGEGCQGRNEFHWVGKVIGFEKKDDVDYVLIEIMIHNHSYGDARDNKEPEIYKYFLANNYDITSDIQEVKGVWILFAN